MVEARIIASEELTLQSVRLKQDISRDSLSFHFQELPQTIHCPHYALVNHLITSSDLDVRQRALNSATGYFRLFESAMSKATRRSTVRRAIRSFSDSAITILTRLYGQQIRMEL